MRAYNNGFMKTMELNKRDLGIIIRRLNPIIFNAIVSLIFGSILIIILPIIINNDSQLKYNQIRLLQIALIILLLVISIGYFLVKSRNERKDIVEKTKIARRQKLLDKKITSRRNYIIYLPENIKDNNLYELVFESKVLEVHRETFDNLEVDKEYELYFTPNGEIFLNIADDLNNEHYCS